jgi:hypothetical protein
MSLIGNSNYFGSDRYLAKKSAVGEVRKFLVGKGRALAFLGQKSAYGKYSRSLPMDEVIN